MGRVKNSASIRFLAFQSTHPVRGGTLIPVGIRIFKGLFQSTHPVRGGTLKNQMQLNSAEAISIHPPREGWDGSAKVPTERQAEISIHPPREGWDENTKVIQALADHFNPPTP